VGSLIASALGVGDTRGIDWIKLIIQVALAAAGVALVAGRSASGTRRPRARAVSQQLDRLGLAYSAHAAPIR